MKVKVDMPSAEQLIRRLGLDKDGAVQRFHTMNVNRRIGKFMPHLTGALETKKKHLRGNTEVEISGPYAGYQYMGKVMVNAKTGKGPALIPGIGYRYRRGTVLKVTERNLEYTKTHNPQAGPKWDRALVAAEGKLLEAELQAYVNRRKR